MTEDTNEKRGNLQVHEPEKKSGSDECCAGGAEGSPSKSKCPRMSKLALIIAIIALVLALQQKLSTQKESIISINQSLSRTVLPELKKLKETTRANNVYDLKRMMVTLDEIKETSTNEEVKTLANRIQNDMRDLGVKLMVYE